MSVLINYEEGLSLRWINLGPEGVGALILLCLWSDSQRSDGYVPRAALPRLGLTAKITARLIKLGELDEVDGGFRVRHFMAYCDTREEIEARRQHEREKKRRQRGRASLTEPAVSSADRRDVPTGQHGDSPTCPVSVPSPLSSLPPAQHAPAPAPRNDAGAGAVEGVVLKIATAIRTSGLQGIRSPEGLAKHMVERGRAVCDDASDEELLDAAQQEIAKLERTRGLANYGAALLVDFEAAMTALAETPFEDDTETPKVVDLDAYRPTDTPMDPQKKAELVARMRARIRGLESREADARARERAEDARDRLIRQEIEAERARLRGEAVNE